MAFNPSSTIFLCNVPFDSTYKHQVYFKTRAEQQNYFVKRVVKTFADYFTVRTTRADGSLQSSVRVDMNIDALRALPCNYMYYQNANHGTRYFYAFIKKLVYINEGVTEIVFEQDVFQTWFLDCTMRQSYVVREHSETDGIGHNIVPEKFSFNDFVYQLALEDKTLNDYGYLIGSTENDVDDSTFWEELFGGSENPVVSVKQMSGIFQGLFFYFFPNTGKDYMNAFLNKVVEKNGDCIVFAAVIPEFCVSDAFIGRTQEEANAKSGWVYGNAKPAEKTITVTEATKNGSFEGYAPVNNKLFTAPFYRLVVTNHNGEQAEYTIEDFADPANIQFTMYGDISANPSVTLVPMNYRGINKNYDAGISISGFPQMSLNTDSFKLWLAKNQFGIGLETVGNVAQIVGGVTAAVATGGVGAAIGGTQIVSGVNGILGTVNSTYQASREPNKSTAGGGKNNLLTAMKLNKYEYFIQTIKREHAQTVDNFFTMYGYQTNKVKIPNLSSRPYFNYVETVDVNIVGGIPADDMQTLKQVFNSGVTLWKPTATMFDYSVDNRPT